MSHTTTIKGLAIRDAAAIASAVVELQASGVACELLHDAKPRMFYEDQHRREGGFGYNNGTTALVVKLNKSRYDLGLDLKADGTYTPVFDAWAGQIASQIGADSVKAKGHLADAGQATIGKFLQSYGKHAAINAASSQGYFVEGVETDAEGTMHLVLAGM